MPSVQRVLIVGGGIAGQALACALAKRRINCEIVELRPDFQILGAAMTFQGTALRALLDVGLTEEVIAAGWQGGNRPVTFSNNVGEVILEPEILNIVGPQYPPQIAIRRQAVHDVLQRGVQKARVPVRMGVSVSAIVDRGATVEVKFTDGSQGSYDLVVGADGIHSAVRSLVFGNVKPQFAGFANWRAILPRPKSVNRMVWMWGRGRSLGVLPVDGDQIYFAGVTKEKDATRYPQEQLVSLVRDKFKGFGGILPEVLAVADEGPWIYTVMEEVKLPPPWHKGRAVLVGDAAHAACPFWAQGAAMALEDAVLLAQLLERTATLEAALQEWQARRYPRCLYVQEGSLETGVLTHADEESDEPKIFPPLARAGIDKQFHAREKIMGEAF